MSTTETSKKFHFSFWYEKVENYKTTSIENPLALFKFPDWEHFGFNVNYKNSGKYDLKLLLFAQIAWHVWHMFMAGVSSLVPGRPLSCRIYLNQLTKFYRIRRNSQASLFEQVIALQDISPPGTRLDIPFLWQ